MRYEHVAFDLDGTLVDSRADLTAAVNHALAALGQAAIPSETVSGYVGEGARVLLERALGPTRQELVPAALDLFLGYYEAHLLDHTRPYRGVAEALAGLTSRAVILSVLTNKPERMSCAIIEGLGLGALFVAIVGGDSLVAARKPDPAGVEYLRARTGTSRDRMLLVGDSPVDLQTARAGGVAFCGVAWGLAPAALRAAGPERIITEPAELVALVAG